MNMKNNILIGGVIVMVVLIGLVFRGSPIAQKTLGSVTAANEYIASTTDTQTRFNNYQVIRKGPGTLGSVVITTTGTSPFNLYDATSTVTNGEWATTTLASFPASPTVGTYTFDVNVVKGILVEFTGSPTATSRASSTITIR